MNVYKEDLKCLIDEYISCSKYMCLLLKDNFDTKGETLLRARRINLIPKTGSIGDEISYSFHGGGCFFEFQNGTIDIDFGPDGRSDGFDAFRLFDFLEASKAEKYKGLLSDRELFIKLFSQLAEEEYIFCPKWFPNSDLYYLKASIK